MRLALAAALLASLGLAGCWEDYNFEYFPPCNADAPPHLRREIMDNADAQMVGNAAIQTGWTNVHVDNGFFVDAVVTGDCPLSRGA